jgi:hypothetical protein
MPLKSTPSDRSELNDKIFLAFGDDLGKPLIIVSFPDLSLIKE